MIINAGDSPLNFSSNLPNVGSALLEWFQAMTFTRVVKTVVNFKAKEVETNFVFRGVRQPFTAQQLNQKPEGQRDWLWEKVHAEPSLILNIDEIIYFNSVKYRVMRKADWKEYGYVEYDIVQDYKT